MEEKAQAEELLLNVHMLEDENANLQLMISSERRRIAELELANEMLVKENVSLKEKVAGLPEPSNTPHKQEEQQEGEGEVALRIMTTRYDDTNFLSKEEKKDLKFEIKSLDVNHVDSSSSIPCTFKYFKMMEKEDALKPISSFINLQSGRFTTPVAGDYRFDVKGKMDSRCHCSPDTKAEWYICHIPIKYNYEGDDDSDDEDDDDDDKKKEKKEKARLFLEKKKRHFLFDSVPDKVKGQLSISVTCEKGVVFWIEVVIVKKGFNMCGNKCHFSGRLIY